MWESTVASIGYLFAIPLLAVLVNAAFLFAYVLDAPVILIPVLLSALPRRSSARRWRAFRPDFPLRVANAVMMLKAAFLELVLRRPFRVYEKGH